MNPRTPCFSLLLALGAFLLALPALADGTEKKEAAPPGFDPAAMEEAWNKARTPGEPHEFLASMAGEWTYVSTMWMDPSQPPMKSGGESKKTMILGGRYLEDEMTGEFEGQAVHGRGLTAYDNTAGEYVGTWIDDMGTGVLVSRGQRDGQSLVMHGELLDPMSGQALKLRMVTRVVDADHHVFEYYMTPPGMPEIQQMVIEYARKGGD